jgi:hypothetical protein
VEVRRDGSDNPPVLVVVLMTATLTLLALGV